MKLKIKWFLKSVVCLLLIFGLVTSCKTKETTTNTKKSTETPVPTVPLKIGYKRVKVSWFENSFYKKRSSNSRDSYSKNGFIAAHRTLPIGTIVEMINPNNNLRIQVKIVHRGPNVAGREFDLSKKAFKELTSLEAGLVYIDYKIVK